MKRMICLALCLTLFMILFSGCGNKNDDGPVRSLPLPENGIVPASELENSKKNSAVLYVKGSCGEYEYQWAVFGTKISEPRDTDFSVSVERTERGYRAVLTESNGYSPSLSIRIPEVLNMDEAEVYDENGTLLCNASVSGYSKYTDVCFYVREDTRSYDVVFSQKEEHVRAETSEEVLPESTDPVPGETAPEVPDYLSPVNPGESLDTATGSVVISDGKQAGKDQYMTDPVPEGKPLPVEPEDQVVSDRTCSCTFSISCATIQNNMDACDPEKKELVPSDGWILAPVSVSFRQGESVFDVLKRVCRDRGIHMEFEWTPIYNSAYVEGIHNLYEFDVGNLSGWMYKVNGWFPNYGCSRYALQDGDTVAWCYTCDLGYDVGGGYAVGG